MPGPQGQALLTLKPGPQVSKPSRILGLSGEHIKNTDARGLLKTQ